MDFKLDLEKLKGLSNEPLRMRKGAVIMAKTAEKMERFSEMWQVVVELIKLLTMHRLEYTEDERKVVASAGKNVAGQLRGAWKALWTDDEYKQAVDDYKQSVQLQLADFCKEALVLAAQVPSGACTENRVFALKLQGDFNRYLAEIAVDADRESPHGKQAASFYEEATDLAGDELDATSPLSLGVALNHAVCYREIFKDTSKACSLAKHAFNQSIARLDNVDDDEYNDTTLIMQLLRDNLTLWSSETA